MKHLLVLGLCAASVSLAWGDDETGSVATEPGARVTEQPDAGATDRDSVPIVEEWCPRLAVMLQTEKDTPVIRIRTVREAIAKDPFNRSGQGIVDYRERKIKTLAASPTDITTLYFDALSIDITNDEENPRYHLECAARVMLRINGMELTADSAVFDKEKCELVNATLTHDGTQVTSEKMTLNLPVLGVVTNTWGRPVPEPEPKNPPLQPRPDPLSTPEASPFTGTY